MKYNLAVVVVVVVVACLCMLRVNSLSSSIIQKINSVQNGWVAGENAPELKLKMGTFQTEAPIKLPVRDITPADSIPASFDSRTEWPGCIGQILNQGECGSCWAFGTAETLSDRFCIHSNGSIHVQLSELDLVACDTLDDGCNGGWPETAWQFAINSGLVIDACIPYNETIPTCPPAQQPCLNFVPTPPCPKKCSNGDNWSSVLHYAADGYAVGATVAQIQTEMMTKGPVQAVFSVYQDFLNYKSGVYKHLTGSYVGGHSVKIIGWGVLNSQPYWLVQNSWTATWGDQGYFMILRGVNECGIEASIYAGLPKLD